MFVPSRGDPRERRGYVMCVAHAASNVPRGADTSGEESWIFDCRLGPSAQPRRRLVVDFIKRATSAALEHDLVAWLLVEQVFPHFSR